MLTTEQRRMTLRRLISSPLFGCIALVACNSGQTGDAGLGVEITNERKQTRSDASVASEEARSTDDDQAIVRSTDAGVEGPGQPPQPIANDDEPAVAVTGTPDTESSNDVQPTPSPPASNDASVRAPSDAALDPPSTAAELPCEVLRAAGLACVSAHSTVRVLVPDYAGPLYQLERPDGELLDVQSVDGVADVQAHDDFCAGDGCTIRLVYDQSGMGNELSEAPPGSAKPTPGNPVAASDLPVSVGGRDAYGMLFKPGMGYRKLIGNGMAQGDEPQTIYMVTSQHDLINGCCFDYGNSTTSANNDGNGTTEAVYFGQGVIWGIGSGSGPWVMADLENGLYPGWENGQDRDISTNTSLPFDFVTAVLVGDTADKNDGQGRFALYGGNAADGEVAIMYDGIRPEKPGYVPMQKQGSVILGVGGDNSDGDGGRFYEGVIANGAASLETVQRLQASIVAAGYGE